LVERMFLALDLAAANFLACGTVFLILDLAFLAERTLAADDLEVFAGRIRRAESASAALGGIRTGPGLIRCVLMPAP
jgi:hypothetical protein